MSADTEDDTLQSVNADMHQLTQATVTLARGKSYQSLLFFVFTQPDGKLITNHLGADPTPESASVGRLVRAANNPEN